MPLGMRIAFALEKTLVRWFGVSLISWIVCRQAGVKPVATIMMTTIGRKSGRHIATPIFYFTDGDRFFVIGSKGGAPEHPVWFRNLEARPEAWLRVGGRNIHTRCRVAEGEERVRLWAQAAKAYPPYDEYQRKAGARLIPVVVFERV